MVTESSGDDARANMAAIELEVAWLATVIDARLRLYFGHEATVSQITELPPPEHRVSSPFGRFVVDHDLSTLERLALILALVPHVRPELLDVFFVRNETFDRRFTEFGGIGDQHSGRFLPTLETLAFLSGGGDLRHRFEVTRLLDDDHEFNRAGLLEAPEQGHDGRPLDVPLRISSGYLGLFTSGHRPRPKLGPDFPAELISTERTWDDLVLDTGTRRQIEDVQTWLDHGETLMRDWAMAQKLRPGLRALFYGAPGTGKTMTATLLGKSSGHDVYRIDLAQVVSKYIGETEKNLDRVFNQARSRRWILLFDEAEALFGKRTEATSAHDRYANQEVAYLLQRVESFDGVVIMATNRRDDLDEAFTRRFEVVVYFPMPGPAERERIWRAAFSPKAQLAPAIDLTTIARDHELTGASIMNVVRFVSLEAIKSGDNLVTTEAMARGVRRELAKDGR